MPVDSKACWSEKIHTNPACGVQPYGSKVKQFSSEFKLYSCNPILRKPYPAFIFLKYGYCPEKLSSELQMNARKRWGEEKKSRFSNSPRYFGALEPAGC